MTHNNLVFLRLYMGRDTRYHGNGRRSYMRAYDCTNEVIATKSASRLLAKPEIKAKVAAWRKKAEDAVIADQSFVLEQSVHLYDVAMGNKPVEVDVIDKQGRVSTVQQRDLNLPVAKGALELIGKHTSVAAFTEQVEHTHTHILQERLRAKSRAVEARALSSPDVIDGHAEEIEEDPTPAEAEKEGASSRRSPDHHPSQPEETSQASGGATGK